MTIKQTQTMSQSCRPPTILSQNDTEKSLSIALKKALKMFL